MITKICHSRSDIIPRKASNYNLKDLQQKLDLLQPGQPVWILTNELTSISLSLHEEKDSDTAGIAGNEVLELQDYKRNKWKELREVSKGNTFRAHSNQDMWQNCLSDRLCSGKQGSSLVLTVLLICHD